MEPIWTLGLMSGTSLDGIDAALILTDGINVIDKGDSLYLPYPLDFQDRLRSMLGQKIAPQSLIDESTNFHIKAAQDLLNQTKHDVKLIGYHGQTIYHAPPETIQIGDAQALFKVTGIPVVYDFRTADCVAGGQGAPLVAIYHQAIINDNQPTVVINIGGVANLTYIQDDTLIAGDIGPGNALINDVMMRDFGKPYDHNGFIALANQPDKDVLSRWLTDPYFTTGFPKSLDRDHFSKNTLDLSHETAIATLTVFTIETIKQSFKLLPKFPKKIYLCGGGANNQALVQGLQPCDILKDSDMIEAQAFAYLAVRVLRNLPTSFPMTTGCHTRVCGGRVLS